MKIQLHQVVRLTDVGCHSSLSPGGSSRPENFGGVGRHLARCLDCWGDNVRPHPCATLRYLSVDPPPLKTPAAACRPRRCRQTQAPTSLKLSLFNRIVQRRQKYQTTSFEALPRFKNSDLENALSSAATYCIRMETVPLTGLEELDEHLDELVENPNIDLNDKLFDHVELQLTGTPLIPLPSSSCFLQSDSNMG